ncbi:hypothetical protein SeMB42_g01668 [Synchytrium endobioticum]|uniref:SH3 domain-containing protein n=1 Tax=Synchytrium endobioticum TaxID=286115 RepID=A0A507D9P7_9FUNG|nr:hypothetical protein SeLEV6574_g02237 [Synchytrium endobioticum]TPX52072.1 hypothetical protein SeMB42_g01668 [Synchytrium endobioticum]
MPQLGTKTLLLYFGSILYWSSSVSAQLPAPTCMPLQGSRACSAFNKDLVMVFPPDYSDVPSFDKYIAQRFDNDTTYISSFQTAYDCPNYNGAGQRYHVSMFCSLLIARSAILGCGGASSTATTNPNVVVPQQLCATTCQSALTSLSSIFKDPAICSQSPGAMAIQARTDTIAAYQNLCTASASAAAQKCIMGEPSVGETVNCGFFSSGERAAYCKTHQDDACCGGTTGTATAGNNGSVGQATATAGINGTVGQAAPKAVASATSVSLPKPMPTGTGAMPTGTSANSTGTGANSTGTGPNSTGTGANSTGAGASNTTPTVPSNSSGASKGLLALVLIFIIGGIIYFLWRRNKSQADVDIDHTGHGGAGGGETEDDKGETPSPSIFTSLFNRFKPAKDANANAGVDKGIQELEEGGGFVPGFGGLDKPGEVIEGDLQSISAETSKPSGGGFLGRFLNGKDQGPGGGKHLSTTTFASSTTGVKAGAAGGAILGKWFGKKQTKRYVAVANYFPTQEDEIEVHIGDELEVIRNFDDGWAEGKHVSKRKIKDSLIKQQGIFPLAALGMDELMLPLHPSLLTVAGNTEPVFVDTVSRSSSMPPPRDSAVTTPVTPTTAVKSPDIIEEVE